MMTLESFTAAPVVTIAAPCVASDSARRHCLAGLLLGVACCENGDCAMCRATRHWMLSAGFTDAAVERSLERTRRGLLDRCPICGFAPPPAITARAPLPRLDRVVSAKSGSSDCVICGQPLERGRRRYCSEKCERLREHRARDS